MTKWSHEEVEALYKRAEAAEEKLAFLARAVLENRVHPTQAEDALRFLASYANPSRTVAALALGLPKLKSE